MLIKRTTYYYYLIIFLLASECCSKKQSELVFVNTVWRHGARTPIYSFPSNPNNDKHVWNSGPGQLTQLGMQNQYDLGLFLRKRYSKFLSEHYNSDEIYIRSTDIDRTLMSAESNLAGLYPPHGYEKWNGTSTNWQPIPIHTVDDDNEHLLRFPPKNCPYYTKVLQPQIDDSDVYQDFLASNQEFFDEISSYSGAEESNLEAVWSVQDTFLCEKAHGIPSPDWLTDDMWSRMNDIVGKVMGYLAGDDLNNNQLKIQISKTGPGQLVKQILKNMKHKIEGKITQKMVAYSAHDTTLAALLTSMDVYNQIQPPFASCIIFELWKKNIHETEDSTDDYFIRTLYRNSTTKEMLKLNLFGSCTACTLEKLIKLSEPYIPDIIITECDMKRLYDLNYKIIVCILSLLLLSTWISIFICKFRRRKYAARLSIATTDCNDDDETQLKEALLSS